MSQRYIGGLIYNPPGGFSGYFDGSGDYLTIADNIALDMEGSDFTIEGWIFPVVSSGGSVGVFSKRASGAVVGGVLLYYDGAGLTPSLLIGSGGSWVINQASSIAFGLGQWNHFAVVRNGTSFVLYINGVAGVSATSSSSVTDNSAAFAIGAWAADGTGAISASYFSNFRVVKGTALYTSAFTPPNGPLQAITNTSLLTCAYSTFRDGSTNNFTITVNGNTAVSTQNPFPLTQLPNPALGNQGNGVYTMSQYQALRSQNLWPAIDQYWPYVTLMLHGNGTNGAQNNTFLDSSTNNFTITRNGNTTQGTFTPYGANWSNLFNGSTDYLSMSNASLAIGNSDFTLECWVYCTSSPTDKGIFEGRSGGTGTAGFTLTAFSGTTVRIFSGSALITSGPINYVNTWCHLAVSRVSGTTTLYVNGISQGTTTSLGNLTDSSFLIGAGKYAFPPAVDAFFPGYISNFRIVKGTAVYTGNFTPPTAPLTPITNTALLTCQSNRFIDNSSNAFAITVNGAPSIQRFSPFNPTTPYAAGVIGGSGYFDGSGDYLSLATSTAFNCGTGDWTIECYVYTSSRTANYPLVFGNNRGSYTTDAVALTSSNADSVSYNDKFVFAWNNGGFISPSAGTSQLLVASTTNTNATWYHFAVVRNGTSIKMYRSGVEVASATISASAAFDWGFNGALIGGGNWDGAQSYFNGYISNFRLVKGTAVYTSAFTPPAVPVTAITNTSLLCNFTNGGIIDNAMMNDLETVGNAQISTSVSKFGGGSLAFDGTGDWLFAPSSPNFALLTGDFTIEMWAYFNNTASTAFFDMRGVGGGSPNNPVFTWSATASTVQAYLNDGYRITSGTLSTGQWYHIALVRSGTTATMYINGVSAGTYTYSTSVAQQALYVGTGYGLGSWNGYIDDLRITKGYARYTANFTPQRSQWQDQ